MLDSNQELIKILKSMPKKYKDITIAEVDAIIEASFTLSKDIPDKSEPGEFGTQRCPCCSNELDLTRRRQYCSNCGQLLELY